MKNEILLAVGIFIASLGFSQTFESSSKVDSEIGSSKVSCAKGKSACCSKAKKKSCGDKSSAQSTSKAYPQTSVKPSMKAIEPKKSENNAAKTDVKL